MKRILVLFALYSALLLPTSKLFAQDVKFGFEGSYVDFLETRSKGFNVGIHGSMLISDNRIWRLNLIDLSMTAGAVFGQRTLLNPKIAIQSVQVFPFHLGVNLGFYLEHYGNYQEELIGFRYGPLVGLNWDGLVNVNYQYGIPFGESFDSLGRHQLTVGIKLNYYTMLSFLWRD